MLQKIARNVGFVRDECIRFRGFRAKQQQQQQVVAARRDAAAAAAAALQIVVQCHC